MKERPTRTVTKHHPGLLEDERILSNGISRPAVPVLQNQTSINIGPGPSPTAQLKTLAAPKPISSPVAQLSKWVWNANTDQWEVQGKHDGDSPPDYDGAYHGEVDDTDQITTTKDDSTFGGKRLVGDSTALAKARWNNKNANFDKWKKGREAQHLIPASLAKYYAGLDSIIDGAENGMMLPAEYDSSNDKLTHRRPKYRDHAKYTTNVGYLMDKILGNTTLKKNQTTYKMVMDALRPVNKLTQYKYLDMIPYSEFETSWNSMYPAYKV